MLAERFSREIVREALADTSAWPRYPARTDRQEWNNLDAATRREIVTTAEAELDDPWPVLPATLFMEFHREGNRSRYEFGHFARRRRLIQLALAECVEGSGRFVDAIVNGIWAICEESYWDVPAHNRYATRDAFGRGGALPDVDRPIVALFSAETGATLALVRHLVGDALDAVDPIIGTRVEGEIRHRLIEPFMERDEWWWLGFVPSEGHKGPPNNWNPWILSNLLTSVLLVESDPELRAVAVHRMLRGLDKFLAGYDPDGGCDEGISYWSVAGGAVFDFLDTLDQATSGTVAIWDDPLIVEMARYVPRMHIGDDWYVNFADGTASARPDATLVYQFGQRIDDATVMNQAQGIAAVAHGEPLRIANANRVLRNVFDPIPAGSKGTFPYRLQDWLTGIEVLTAREREGSPEGLFLAAKGGHNAESHNHNDIGSFIVGVHGEPLIIDAGVGVYTAKTFSAERYSIWTMNSDYHNLPFLEGFQQATGEAFRAREVAAELTDERASLNLDIAGAWPADAGIESWRRSMSLERGSPAEVVILDTWRLANLPTGMGQTLMLAGDVSQPEPGQLVVERHNKSLTIEFDGSVFQVEIERIEIDDARLNPVWGDSVHRVRLAMREPSLEGTTTIRVRRQQLTIS